MHRARSSALIYQSPVGYSEKDLKEAMHSTGDPHLPSGSQTLCKDKVKVKLELSC